MTISLYVHGFQGPTEEAAERVRRFRECAEVIAGLVLPWDRPAAAEHLDLELAATVTGTLWSGDGECRWRVEGDRAVVTILSETPLEGLALEPRQADAVDGGELRWQRPPFTRDGSRVSAKERTYVIEGRAAHRRVHIQEA